MKKLFIILIVPFLSFGQNLYTDLLYYYSFSENGNFLAVDATGNNFTATLNNVENTTDRFGNDNSAKQFNGENSFISIPYQATALAPFPVSYSFWVKLDSVGHVGGVIRNEFIDNYYTGSWVNIQAESINMAYGNCGSAGQQSRRSRLTNHFFLNEQWHHVVAVFTEETDGSGSSSWHYLMKMYINGIEMSGEYSGTGSEHCYGNGDYLGDYMDSDAIDTNDGLDWGGAIGKFDSNTPASPAPYGDTIYHFKGKLDEIGYWTRALSVEEVLEIYQDGLFNEGCMSEEACNYSAEAVSEDGSCEFPGEDCEGITTENMLFDGVLDENCNCIESLGINRVSFNKKIIKVLDLLGREMSLNSSIKNISLYIYDDGSVEKKYIIK